jgi:hypothetical protein
MIWPETTSILKEKPNGKQLTTLTDGDCALVIEATTGLTAYEYDSTVVVPTAPDIKVLSGGG